MLVDENSPKIENIRKVSDISDADYIMSEEKRLDDGSFENGFTVPSVPQSRF